MKEKELKALIEYLEKWIDGTMVEATYPYKCLRKDREVYAFGWRMGVNSVLQKLIEIRQR
jgi:hypothetical protein